jgi:hypothetical protein
VASRACIALALALALVLGLALAVTACGRSREQAERSCDDACSAVQAKVHDLDPSDASPALDIEGDDRAIEETLKNADALCAAAQKTDRATYIRSWVERERGRDKERAAEQARVADGFLMDEWRMRERSIRAALADARRLGPKSSAWGAYVHSARAALDRFRPTRLVKTPAWIELTRSPPRRRRSSTCFRGRRRAPTRRPIRHPKLSSSATAVGRARC